MLLVHLTSTSEIFVVREGNVRKHEDETEVAYLTFW